MSGRIANDPDTRVAALRREIDSRFANLFNWVRDELEKEPPEVRDEAQFWVDMRSFSGVDFTATLLSNALTRIRRAEAMALPPVGTYDDTSQAA